MQNALKSNEWRRIWVLETFKLKYRRGDQIIPPSAEWIPPRN